MFGIKSLAIPFAFFFAFKMHIKEKRFRHSICWHIRQCSGVARHRKVGGAHTFFHESEKQKKKKKSQRRLSA